MAFLIRNNWILTIEKRFLKRFTAVNGCPLFILCLEVTELSLKYDKAWYPNQESQLWPFHSATLNTSSRENTVKAEQTVSSEAIQWGCNHLDLGCLRPVTLSLRTLGDPMAFFLGDDFSGWTALWQTADYQVYNDGWLENKVFTHVASNLFVHIYI